MTIVQEPLRALSLVCSLKHGSERSSTELLSDQLTTQLHEEGVHCESVRCVDYDIRPGVERDMGDGDQWPQVCDKVLGADILILGTPTWLGHMSSVAQRVLERLNAELSATDEEGRALFSGKVAIAAVVGNEDGAHKITADLFQVDRARTFRPHAGESLKDRAAWPGLLLVAFGIIAVVLGLAAAAYQFYGWTIVLGVAALLCFVSGWLWLHLERQRIRQLDSAEHQ